MATATGGITFFAIFPAIFNPVLAAPFLTFDFACLSAASRIAFLLILSDSECPPAALFSAWFILSLEIS